MLFSNSQNFTSNSQEMQQCMDAHYSHIMIGSNFGMKEIVGENPDNIVKKVLMLG